MSTDLRFVPPPRSEKAAAGGRRAAGGLAAAVVGGVVTTVSHSNAGPGDTYFVWWGPVVFGIAYLLQGLGWMTDRAAPGWYAVDGAGRRFWDGTRWTDRAWFSSVRDVRDGLRALRAAGLEAEGGGRLTDEQYGAAPPVAVQTARVGMPSLGEGRGGRLFAFDDPEDLAAVRQHYADLGAEDPGLASWTFVLDNLLLQLPASVPEAQAQRYNDVLHGLGQPSSPPVAAG